MRLLYLILIVVGVSLFSCVDEEKDSDIKTQEFDEASKTEGYNEVINGEHIVDMNNSKLDSIEEWRKEEDLKPDFPIDSITLKKFWNSFRESIRNDDRKNVVSKLDFPVHAIHPVIFKYSHDCDTSDYIKNEEKYANFDIDEKNINEYYDFIFTPVLKNIILQTSYEMVLEKGIRSKNESMVTYTFFAKDYKVKVKCANDHNLKFYIFKESDEWKISIGGL